MFVNILLLLIIVLAFYFVVKARIAQKTSRSSYANVPDDIKLSPFSKALAELVAIAGGIYISLLMLTAFLSLAIPERVQLSENILIDPLALLAVVFTLIQPVIIKILKIVKVIKV